MSGRIQADEIWVGTCKTTRQQGWERKTKTGCSRRVVTQRKNPIKVAQAPAQIWRFPTSLFLWQYSSSFFWLSLFLALSPVALNAPGIPGAAWYMVEIPQGYGLWRTLLGNFLSLYMSQVLWLKSPGMRDHHWHTRPENLQVFSMFDQGSRLLYKSLSEQWLFPISSHPPLNQALSLCASLSLM